MASKYDNTHYMLGRLPERMEAHNSATWNILHDNLRLNSHKLHYQTLVALAHAHKSGTRADKKPASFIRYCIRSGWLREVL